MSDYHQDLSQPGYYDSVNIDMDPSEYGYIWDDLQFGHQEFGVVQPAPFLSGDSYLPDPTTDMTHAWPGTTDQSVILDSYAGDYEGQMSNTIAIQSLDHAALDNSYPRLVSFGVPILPSNSQGTDDQRGPPGSGQFGDRRGLQEIGAVRARKRVKSVNKRKLK
jgi:hypothetical protein